MAAIGRRNNLRIVQKSTSGLYLDGGDLGEILLPARYVTKEMAVGRHADVFVHLDSEDRLVATTETPHAMVGEFAYLRVAGTHPRIGAFLDWGLTKELLLPMREQAHRVARGEWVVAYVFLDTMSGRIVATTRLNRHLGRTEPPFKEGQAVKLLIASETPLGYKAIIGNSHAGLLYHTDLSGPLQVGQTVDGYVRTVRAEGKIDLSLDQAGYQRVASLSDRVMQALEANGGRLEFDDDSSPEAIREAFQVSKKAFKQAIGALFRERLIRFSDHGIELSGKPPERKGR